MSGVTRNSQPGGNNPQQQNVNENVTPPSPPSASQERENRKPVVWKPAGQDVSEKVVEALFWVFSVLSVTSLFINATYFSVKGNHTKEPFFFVHEDFESECLAYVSCAVALCSIIGAIACFLLTWREKQKRIIATVVLFLIVEVYFAISIVYNGLKNLKKGETVMRASSISFLVHCSPGIICAFIWAEQRLAWLRGIIGVVSTIIFFVSLATLFPKPEEWDPSEYLKKCCFSLVNIASFSSVAFTLFSFLFACMCCCTSWKDDGEAYVKRTPEVPPQDGTTNCGGTADGLQGIQQNGANDQAVCQGTDHNV